jgi:hypothetical protein
MAEEQAETKDRSSKQKSKSAAEAGAPAGGGAQGAESFKVLCDETSRASYANVCRATGTPEEVIMDFALNPNAFGMVVDEPVKINHRIVMSYQAAKRTALVLLETVRRHEERFGEIELDPRKRLRSAPAK